MRNSDPKRIVDVKDIGHDAIQYTNADGEKRTYYPARSIWLTVETLEVHTSLLESLEDGCEPIPTARVSGTAMLDDRSISVVGDPESEVRTLKINLIAGDWRFHPKHQVADFPMLGSPLGRAELGFNRHDWEIGNDDEWAIRCMLPQTFIDVLITEVRRKQMHGMEIRLELKHLYSTVHDMALSSIRGDLFLRPDMRTNSIEIPKYADGYVASISFTADKCDFRAPVVQEPQEMEEPTVVEPIEPPPEPLDQTAMAIALLVGRIDLLRTTVKWVGGLIFIGLLLIAIR